MEAAKARVAGAGRPRRPRDRRERILAVAGRRFNDEGYHNVGMADIAAEVGITAGALYRHVRGKQDLLAYAMLRGVERFEAVLGDQDAALDDMLAAAAALAVERRDLGALWQRETRHLSEEWRRELRIRLRRTTALLTEAVGRERPELCRADADLLAWVSVAALGSPSHHTVRLPRARFELLLHQITRAICTADVPPARTAAGPRRRPVAGRPTPVVSHVSHREALLAAATRLFNQRGYQAVSLQAIGSAAGVTGTSVYNHFANKSELLVAALVRANETLQLGLARALAGASSPSHALELMLRSYVELTLDHGDLMGTLVTEVINLPTDQRHALRRIQHDYVGEWIDLLTRTAPGLPAADARVRIHAVLTAVNDTARTPHLRSRPGLGDELVHLGLDVLGTARRPEG